MPDIQDLKQIEADLGETQTILKSYMEKADGQFAEQGEVSEQLKGELETLSGKLIEITDAATALEQKLADQWNEGRPQGVELVNLGKMVTESEGWQGIVEGKQQNCRVLVKNALADAMEQKAIINATGLNQPLVPGDRLTGIIAEPERVLRMRNVLSVGRTSSNMIEYAKENVFTNLAGPQVGGSPEAFENVTKPESNITFTLANEAVSTLAHWVPVSKQVLSDSPMLSSYVNTRMMYGLKLKEDTQILLGTGANGELSGLYTNRTAYSTSSPLDYTTKLDVIRDAMTQCHTSEYMPTAIILNPSDWADIELSKDSQGRYIFANPQSAAAPALWGLPVVVTNSMAAGTFLVGAFDMAAQLWDREDASIEIGLNSDNFVKNMVTILAEERLAVTIYRAAGLVGGAFPA